MVSVASFVSLSSWLASLGVDVHVISHVLG